MENNDEIEEYVASLTPLQKKAFDIAKDHLGSSFNIHKSIGFLQWKENKENKENTEN
jgi:hypothetical protein